jgi:hypothetical protein
MQALEEAKMPLTHTQHFSDCDASDATHIGGDDS